MRVLRGVVQVQSNARRAGPPRVMRRVMPAMAAIRMMPSQNLGADHFRSGGVRAIEGVAEDNLGVHPRLGRHCGCPAGIRAAHLVPGGMQPVRQVKSAPGLGSRCTDLPLINCRRGAGLSQSVTQRAASASHVGIRHAGFEYDTYRPSVP